MGKFDECTELYFNQNFEVSRKRTEKGKLPKEELCVSPGVLMRICTHHFLAASNLRVSTSWLKIDEIDK